MNNRDLDLAIAELLYPKYRCVSNGCRVVLYTGFRHCKDRNNFVKIVDYCNNWDDLMPEVTKRIDDFDPWVIYGCLKRKYPKPSLARSLLRVLKATNE